ncbi:MAG TPA: YjgP/YjgQ family permease [Phycisphaerales bacterium]|nr:YjgP/YjgQ family permease [Phycisphaerales bacterium]
MVFTLHRYIFRDLLRVFVLTAVVLTAMLSLTTMVGSMQKFGVPPEQILHLLGYFLPITLTFVLPMSALFAAALVYGRLASDNELDACKASGIGLMTLVYPGLCLAIVIAIANLVLSFHVVPAFIHRAERALKANTKQILFRNIQRNGYYTLPPDNRYRIYADRADPANDLLFGVIITDFQHGRINKITTAETAKIIIDTHKGFNEVTIVALETYQIDDLGQSYSQELAVNTTFPPLLSDNIKFQKIEQIKEIRADMMTFYPVRKLAEAARAQLSMELLAEEIAEKIAEESRNHYQLEAEDRILMFTAAESRASDERTIDLVGPIELREYTILGEPICQYNSNSGKLLLSNNDVGTKMVMDIDAPTWEFSDGRKGIAQRHVVRYISFPETVAAKLDSTDFLSQDPLGSMLKQPSGILTNKLDDISFKVTSTINEIIAETHTRLVFGLGCITLVMISIALGIIFKGGHLLTAFGTSTVPAGVLIVCIMAGKNLTKARTSAMPESTGIIVMWAGLAVLSVLCFVIYRKLMKT